MPENWKKNQNPKHDDDILEDYDSKTAKNSIRREKYYENAQKQKLTQLVIHNNHLEIHLTKHTLVEMPVYSEDSVSCFSFSEWVLKKGMISDFSRMLNPGQSN